MTVNAVGGFVNYYSDAYKSQSTKKSEVCAHAARRKHEKIRTKRKDLLQCLNAQVAVQPLAARAASSQMLPSPPLSPNKDQNHMSSVRTLQTILYDERPLSPPLTENEDDPDVAPKSPQFVAMENAIKGSLFNTSTKLPHSCIDYFHLLLPPAFCGVDVPLTMLMPENKTPLSLKNFAYLHSIFYHRLVTYIFDADTIYYQQTQANARLSGQFSYAICALIQLMRDWSRNESDEASQYVLMNAARAMARIRTALCSKDAMKDDILLVELTSLASLAQLLGHDKAYILHSTMLQTIVQRRGGFEALNDHRMSQAILKTCQIATSDGRLSAVFEKNASKTDSTIEVGPISLENNSIISRLPEGFRDLSEVATLSDRALRLLDRTTGLVRAKDYEAHLNTHNRYPKTFNQLGDGSPDTIRPDFGNPSVEKLLDLALTLYIRVGFGTIPASNRLFLMSRLELKRCVRLFRVGFGGEAHKEFLIWAWTIAIDSWRTSTDTLALVGQELLCDLKMQFPETMSWFRTEQIISKYFWTTDLSRYAKAYW